MDFRHWLQRRPRLNDITKFLKNQSNTGKDSQCFQISRNRNPLHRCHRDRSPKASFHRFSKKKSTKGNYYFNRVRIFGGEIDK